MKKYYWSPQKGDEKASDTLLLTSSPLSLVSIVSLCVLQWPVVDSRRWCKTYAPPSTCTELHLSGKFLSLSLTQSELRSSRLPAKFRCSKRVTWGQRYRRKNDEVCWYTLTIQYRRFKTTSIWKRHLTHPPTGPVEGTLEHRPQLAVDIRSILMNNYTPNKPLKN